MDYQHLSLRARASKSLCPQIAWGFLGVWETMCRGIHIFSRIAASVSPSGERGQKASRLSFR